MAKHIFDRRSQLSWVACCERSRSPLYPQKRTFKSAAGMPAKGQWTQAVRSGDRRYFQSKFVLSGADGSRPVAG